MKVTELTGSALDMWVTHADGLPLNMKIRGMPKPYSTDWAIGGPIIERERISVVPHDAGSAEKGKEWRAVSHPDTSDVEFTGPTPLIAAMRAYVGANVGADVPEQ